MTPQDLIAALEVLGEAPDGVQRLRELVLQLAVRGKLVPQDPEDEPASVLLERIAAEKARLVKEKAIRKRKPLPPVEDEGGDGLPPGWASARLGQVIFLVSGQHLKPAEYNNTGVGIPYLTGPADFTEAGPVATRWTQIRKAIALPGDILLTVKGAGIGKTNVAEAPETAISRQLMAVRPIGFSARFAELVLLTLTAHLRDAQVGIAIPGIGRADVRLAPACLPPLAEQHRIVARVDELMGLLDRLEAARDARDGTRTALRDAALAALRDADDAEAVTDAWARIAEHMDDLFTDPADVAPLRQAILQLAVRGRLVPQDPEDEPASDTLVKGVVRFLNGYAFKSSWYVTDGVRVVRNQNVSPSGIDWTDAKRVSQEHAEEFRRFELDVGDIVLSLDRPLISSGLKVAVVGEHDLPCLLLQRVACPRPVDDRLVKPYFLVWLRSPAFVDTIDPGRSNGVPHISTRAVEKMTLRLPSVAEQHRIVAKVDALLALCDDLEARLTAARDAQAAFAAAAVHHLDA